MSSPGIEWVNLQKVQQSASSYIILSIGKFLNRFVNRLALLSQSRLTSVKTETNKRINMNYRVYFG